MKQNELLKNPAKLREERYNYAVGVAADLFLEKGIDEVKMTDIAENCGMGVASLYRHFETKTEIVILAGRILWERENADFLKYVEKGKSETGLDRLVYLLGYFKNVYENQKSFIKFLDDFDRLMLSEGVNPAHLENYGSSIVNLYDPIKAAYETGIKDGTIRKIDDLQVVYAAVTHSLMALCQKFIRGAILSGDQQDLALKEIDKILDMTAVFLAA